MVIGGGGEGGGEGEGESEGGGGREGGGWGVKGSVGRQQQHIVFTLYTRRRLNHQQNFACITQSKRAHFH